jgi:sterol desaturase/sphingolipid hydroxylase (fatty acid hydroxylase superfamily)
MVAQQHFSQGLLDEISNPFIKVFLSFLAIDLLLYSWHMACHHVDGLWVFHKVHHNDPALNVSTGFRVHVVELLVTHLLKAAMVIVMGIEISIVFVSEVVTTLFIMFHHSNISFKGEKWFGLVFNTPYLHRAHHSTMRDEHDSNYGAVLSIWDRIFDTLMERKPSAIGIKGSSPQDFLNLVKFGFTMQTPPVPLLVYSESMIAEAAYYRAEKRNFYPGQDLKDWFEAKKEIASLTL